MPHSKMDVAPLEKIAGELREIAKIIDRIAGRPATGERDHGKELGKIHEALADVANALRGLGERHSK